MNLHCSHHLAEEEPRIAMSFEEAVRFLEDRINFEKIRHFSQEEMGKRLEHLQRILLSFGNPERRYRTIHIAGTKGKGSTCAMLESILLEGGYHVGCFTSPHLYSFLERFRHDGNPCSESEFADLMSSIRDRLAVAAPKMLENLTYFELTTLFAFEYFALKKVDIAIFEVGMGGRLDATNLCRPCITAIPSIAFDHMEQLGPTLEDITMEKGGIVKPGIPLVSTVRSAEVKSVLKRIVREADAPAYFLGEAFLIHHSGDGDTFLFETVASAFPLDVRIDALFSAMPGTHQKRNAAVAVAVILLLRYHEQMRLDDEAIVAGLRKAHVPVRVEVFRPSKNSPVFVVDGAHNRSSIRAFAKTVRELFPDRRLRLVFGTTIGKDIEGMLMELLPHFDSIILTQYSSNSRRFPPQGLKTILSSLPNVPARLQCDFIQTEEKSLMEDSIFSLLKDSAGLSQGEEFTAEIEIAEDSRDALRRCWDQAGPDDVVCVTGSLYLAAELRQYFLDHLNGNGES